jgi:hypothetical protein
LFSSSLSRTSTRSPRVNTNPTLPRTWGSNLQWRNKACHEVSRQSVKTKMLYLQRRKNNSLKKKRCFQQVNT